MLDFLEELKDNFNKFCTAQDMYDKKEYKSSVERWAMDYGKFLERNGNSYTLEYYKEFFKNVTTNQLVTNDEVFVLFRYTDGCDFDFDPLISRCRSIVIDVKNMDVAILPFVRRISNLCSSLYLIEPVMILFRLTPFIHWFIINA